MKPCKNSLKFVWLLFFCSQNFSGHPLFWVWNFASTLFSQVSLLRVSLNTPPVNSIEPYMSTVDMHTINLLTSIVVGSWKFSPLTMDVCSVRLALKLSFSFCSLCTYDKHKGNSTKYQRCKWLYLTSPALQGKKFVAWIHTDSFTAFLWESVDSLLSNCVSLSIQLTWIFKTYIAKIFVRLNYPWFKKKTKKKNYVLFRQHLPRLRISPRKVCYIGHQVKRCKAVPL